MNVKIASLYTAIYDWICDVPHGMLLCRFVVE